MADNDHLEGDEALEASQQMGDETAVEAEEEVEPKLQLEVAIENRSACERHITVKVSHEDIERFFGKQFDELTPSAQVPGFRPGRAPRKLIESRFRKDVAEKVKAELLMSCLDQINDEYHLSAISEPDLDLETVVLPEEGPMTFEFNIEVRPDFDLPKWKGLAIEKPSHEITPEEVDRALKTLLTNRGRLVPVDGAAAVEDFVTVNLTAKDGDNVLSTEKELVLRVRSTLTFRDATVENFSVVLLGAKAGDVREAQALVSPDAPNESLRGKTIILALEVLEVKRLSVPELTPELLEELGGFELEADLRDAIKDSLSRRLDYEQHRRARAQITKALTDAATWELPPELLKRQSHRELQRAVMELQRSGFSEDAIRTHENELRQNSRTETARALKEHFILERIAEDQKIDADEEDYETEIRLIGAQSGEAPRRVRARLEKSGSMDVLRNQVIERKVIDLILANASFKEVPYNIEKTESEAINIVVAGGSDSEIPEAKAGGDAEATPNRPERPTMRG